MLLAHRRTFFDRLCGFVGVQDFLNSCSLRMLFREYSPDNIVKFLKTMQVYDFDID